MPSGGLFLFTGPDRPRKLQRLQALERSLAISPFDRHQLDASAVTAAQLGALCRQRPAASPCRLVVVDQAHRLDARCVGEVLQHGDAILATTCLVLLVEQGLTAKHPLAQAQRAFTIEDFPGRDAPAAKPFALTDALGTRDAAAALIAVRDQLIAGREPIELLGLVVWQVQRWILVKRLLEAGEPVPRIVEATGLKQWQVQRLQAEVARRTMPALDDALGRCWQTDVEVRSGRVLPELAVEQLVVELCV